MRVATSIGLGTFLFAAATVLPGCGDSDSSSDGSGGSPSTGGSSSAGAPGTGGSGTGGTGATGGAATGGSAGTGTGGSAGSPMSMTVYDVASASPDYSSLVAAVDKAGLAPALQDSSATLTVFAPDNEAFAALLTAIGASSLDDLTVEQLTPVLLYHVLGMEVDGTAATAAATNGDKVSGLGGSIQLGLSGTDIQLDGSAIVEAPDIMADNGIIHGIDAVILPSITDVVVSDSSFSSLAAALTAADTDASAPDLVGTLDEDSGDFTVFAPTDAAFSGLVTALGAGNTGITGLGDFQPYQLVPVLRYHVVPSRVLAANVTTGDVATLGGTVAADTSSGVAIDGVSVDTADILTSNGVIHVIGGVLVPSITDVVTTAPELDSLKTAVLAADNGAGTPKVAPALDAAATTGFYTLFAPSNAAFGALPATPSGQALTNVLLYHVLNEATPIYASDALGLSSPTAFDTLLGSAPAQQITVSATGSPADTVNLDDAGSATNTTVTAPNYFTANGVIHVIDKVLLPN